ncbi:hypothetical protein GX50_03130 [[Emmonsia] crescens]|uniref:Uncharacterized protein n=1 Tax=[Emmonsia] crescens TaxID=73230 RepID=A0A2B7ZC92_9EURO|nr:hypothetical protein GX50_03130 [Emmonsia crescens]
MDPHPLIFDPDSLYILLSGLGDAYRFYWGLLLRQGSQLSQAFGCRQDRTLRARAPRCGGGYLKKIPIAHSQRFKEDISCRVWVLEASYELDNSGFIKLGQGGDRKPGRRQECWRHDKQEHEEKNCYQEQWKY